MPGSQSAEAAVFGIDLGKTRFDVMAADASSKPLRRAKLSRSTILPFFEQVPRALIGMEACPGAQWLARKLGSDAISLTFGIIARQSEAPGEDWTVPDFVDKAEPHAEARSNASGLMPPRWLWRRVRL